MSPTSITGEKHEVGLVAPVIRPRYRYLNLRFKAQKITPRTGPRAQAQTNFRPLGPLAVWNCTPSFDVLRTDGHHGRGGRLGCWRVEGDRGGDSMVRQGGCDRPPLRSSRTLMGATLTGICLSNQGRRKSVAMVDSFSRQCPSSAHSTASGQSSSTPRCNNAASGFGRSHHSSAG